MGKNIPKERKEGMYKAILELKSLEECFDFFEDICAMTELRSMEQRFKCATKSDIARCGCAGQPYLFIQRNK